MPNSFGKLFTITTWGESHGAGIGVVLDGCPPLLPLDAAEIQADLDRRRPGQSDIVTPRDEADRVEILSGLFEGKTTGAPIAMLVRNADHRPAAYDDLREKFRPSHADFAYQAKYGHRDHRGGGRSSARETIARVAAGAIAKKILATQNIEIRACVTRIHDIAMPPALVATGANATPPFPTQTEIESNPVRCPHAPTAAAMIERIKQIRAAGDSVGGLIQCRVRNLPPGLGEPVFDRLEADLAKAMLSIPATKGFEIGSGFAGTLLKGTEHNDPWLPATTAAATTPATAPAATTATTATTTTAARPRTATNHSGGVQGGISNGEEIYFNIAFKPTPTIAHPQRTIDRRHAPVELAARGRHDPCVLPRAVPIVEAMTALVLADHLMRHHAQNGTFGKLKIKN